MRARAGVLRIIVSLLLAASLCGCSALKLGYATLPELSFWWLDGYFDFTDDQEPAVRQELKSLLAWHRSAELPRAAELLSRMEQIASGPVTPAQVCAFVPEAQQRLLAIAEQAGPGAASVALTFTPAQLRHLESKYSRRNSEWRRDMIENSGKSLELREKQWVDRLEMVYGSLDDPQKSALRQMLAQSMFDATRILRERQRRQQDLLQTLRRIQSPGVTAEQARALLRGNIERTRQSPDAPFQVWQDAMVEESCRLMASVHGTTTAEQRTRAVRQLRVWQRDLRELAAQK